MADSSDIENSLLTLIGNAFYPNTVAQPSVVNNLIALLRGWPTEAQIQQAVKVNAVIISVHADKGMARDATRYLPKWTGQPGTPTLYGAIADFSITFANTPSSTATSYLGHAIAVQCQGVWFPYLAQMGDTLTTIAAAFATMIPNATSAGVVLTLPTFGIEPDIRVVMVGTAMLEVSRQQAMFRLSCWAPTPALRDSVFRVLPGMVRYLGGRLAMPDTSIATLLSTSESGPDDVPARANEWRRDILIKYDWAVYYSVSAMPLLLLQAVVGARFDTSALARQEYVTDDLGDPYVDAAPNIFQVTTQPYDLALTDAADVTYPANVLVDANGNPFTDLAGAPLGSF